MNNSKRLSANEKETILNGITQINNFLDNFKQIQTYEEFDETISKLSIGMDEEQTNFKKIIKLAELSNEIQTYLNKKELV